MRDKRIRQQNQHLVLLLTLIAGTISYKRDYICNSLKLLSDSFYDHSDCSEYLRSEYLTDLRGEYLADPVEYFTRKMKGFVSRMEELEQKHSDALKKITKLENTVYKILMVMDTATVEHNHDSELQTLQ